MFGASRRQFVAVRTRHGRGPPPGASSRRCESIEPTPNNFHQLFEQISKHGASPLCRRSHCRFSAIGRRFAGGEPP
ncbi:UNVERIFIED_CONTAM: hypothetical protein Sradi_3623500 [Sesamum radiatum]|uniref:Uncharacterized protein n=1 Tax=Sesamum radiatum TaxID=300843 RepID=A0AAW2QHG5_SESRA